MTSGAELAAIAPDHPYEREKTRKIINNISKGERLNIFDIQQQDSFEIQDHFDRLKVSEMSGAILSFFGFGCASMIYDLTYKEAYDPDMDETIGYLYALCTSSTILLLLSILWRTYLEFVWQRSKGEHALHHSLISSGKYKQLLVELVINILHPVWFLDGMHFTHHNTTTDTEADYSYTAILAFCTLFRIYHVIRYLAIMTYYQSGRAQRVCNMNGTEAGSWFAVKCLMKDEPLMVVSLLMILSILMGGYAIRIFERPFSEASGMDFSEYGNTMWLVILTMTTVGYGDYFPVTFLGRTCGFVVCIWGVLVVSLMVVTITNMLSLDSGEENALLLFRRLEYKKELRLAAAEVIVRMYKYRIFYKREPDNAQKLKEQLGNSKMSINNFKKLRLQERSLYDLDSVNDRIERKVNSIVDSSEKTQMSMERTLANLRAIRNRRKLINKT